MIRPIVALLLTLAGLVAGTSEWQAAERGASERGIAERVMDDRGPAERTISDRAMAERAGLERGTLEGRLLDQANERPIPGAAVTLIVSGQTRITNVEGRFSFGDLDVRGPDTLVVRHLAYDSLRISIGTEDLGPLDLELLVAARPIPVAGVRVEVNQRARTEARYLAEISNGFLWEHEEFERWTMSADHPADVLRWSGKVALVTEGANGYRCVELRLQAGCAQILLNNVRVHPDVIRDLPAEEIESYVVIRPPDASTFYGTGAAGGVVVIYLRGR